MSEIRDGTIEPGEETGALDDLPPNVDILNLDGLYVLYDTDDASYHHMRRHSHYPSVRPSDIPRRIPFPRGDIETLWDSRMDHPLRRVGLHLWRQGLPFACIDVGAHLGIFTLSFAALARSCEKPVEIYAFEPSARTFPLLARSLRINQVEDLCTAVNLAVAGESGSVEFLMFDRNSAVSSGLEAAVPYHGNAPATRVPVRAVSLDDFVEERGIRSHLICKIDAEGWDLKVVEGLRRCRSDRLVIMQLEFSPGLLESYADPVEALASLSADYVLMEVVLERDFAETGVRRIGTRRSDLAAFVERARATPFRCEDVLALPKGLPASAELLEGLHEDRSRALEDRARALEGRLDRTADHLTRLTASRSWQITAPLRAGRGWIRRHIA